MSMSPNKAVKLLQAYSNNDFNAYKTLKENGYTELTALKASKKILNTARRTVNERLNLDSQDNKDIAKTSLEILGVSEQQVVEQLKTIAFNQRDYANALKVLSILAKDVGLELDKDDNTTSVPAVTLTLGEKTAVIDAQVDDEVETEPLDVK